ncbi:MAG: cysteine desulfurase [Treponematales bacterium]
MNRRYFDWAAAAVPDPAVSEALSGAVFGNPSSPHEEGRKAREAVESARARCARVLDVPPETLYFTSGGTESNALVIHAQLLRPGRGRLLYSAVEHPSVRENCLRAGRLGRPAAVIGVGADGRVSAETLGQALDKHPDARFAAVMAVNNETGAINDMKTLAACLRSRPGPPLHLHSDLVQAAGKIPLDIRGWDLDSASFSAHKLGGPRGAGLLYLKKPLEPVYTGGEQERGVRAGTENTAGALALALCLERRAGAALPAHLAAARQRCVRLITALRDIPRCRLLPEDRAEDDPRFSPWILQAAFRGAPGAALVRALDAAGFAVSTGSACSSSAPERPVLAAMGLDEEAQREGIRISQGWTTTPAGIAALLAALKAALALL